MHEVPGWAYGIRSVVIFSGAGISTDSGIADFRGPTGAWTMNPGLEGKRTFQAFMADPELRRRYWETRAAHAVWSAEPNVAHFAVATLADSGIDTVVVTQNTDELHQRAGMPADRVIELHGTMHKTICVSCADVMATSDVVARVAAGESTPACPRCGGILKTATTMFGQTVDPEVFSRAREALESCDLVLAIGTSLTVEPPGSLCAGAVRAGATLVIVNKGSTPYDGIAAAVINEPLGEALPRIVGQLKAAAGDRTWPADGPRAAGPGLPAGWLPRPSRLLRAAARTAAFRGRRAELERLRTWCAGGESRTLLLYGPAGVGKSRLALELAGRLTAAGKWDVEFLAGDSLRSAGGRPLLVIVDDAEMRQDSASQLLRLAEELPPIRTTRVLLLARTRGDWWDKLRGPDDGTIELGIPDYGGTGEAEAVRDVVNEYEAALTARDCAYTPPDEACLRQLMSGNRQPGAVQASVLAHLLGDSRQPENRLAGHEVAYLRNSASEYGLELSQEAVSSAAVIALLCGAATEKEALAVLGAVPGLRSTGTRAVAAQWLRGLYGPADSGQDMYLDDSFPGSIEEDLVAAVITPQFLLRTLTETTQQQDRRALAVLARAADTRPALRKCLVDLLALLPGLSPAAVDVAVSSGYPAPLAEALTALAGAAALPADLLDHTPRGTTLLGDFPVVLAQSLVKAYEGRQEREHGLRGLARTLIQLAERLGDLGRAQEALAAANRALETAERLAEPLDYVSGASAAVRRATSLCERQSQSPAAAGGGPGA